jgi:hypothetical protein
MDELKDMVREVMQENRQILQSDHDILIELKGALLRLAESSSDHEKRIRILERFIMYGVGALAMAKFIFDMVPHHS